MLKLLKRLYRDEQGAVGLETLLIVAAIALPLLGIMIFYRDDISKWVKGLWEKYRTAAQNDIPTASDSPIQ